MVTDEQIRWFRMRRSGLVEPFADPEQTAQVLAGVQAQILNAALLNLRSRSATGAESAASLTERLFVNRSLVRLWGQRHTLHLYATSDWPMIQAAFASRKTWWEREAILHGTEFDLAAHREGIVQVAKLLRAQGTLSRDELRNSGLTLPEALLSPWGGVFAELARIGEACLAQWQDGEARYAHREHWLPELTWVPPGPAEANVELARRYFACYGPAKVQDFAYWRAGALIGEGRQAFNAIAEELKEVETEARAKNVKAAPRQYVRRVDLDELHATPPEREAWPVRLLGRFDPLVLAHKDKSWVVPERYYDRVWRPAGHIEAVVLERGQAVATWRYKRLGAGMLGVRVFPFKRGLPRHVGVAVRREAKEIARFFGLERTAVTIERAAAH